MSVKVRRSNRSNAINSKIIDPLKSGVHILGPSQMATPLNRPVINGTKTSSAKKRKHADSQSDYQSLDEMLVDSLPTSGPTDEIPTTSNLANVLSQGLQSGHEQMISTVLDRCDIELIRETIQRLPNDQVEALLSRLHKLFFSKGDKCLNYYNWLTILLQEKLSVILMSKSAQQELAALKQLFATRSDILDRICALRGKLTLISHLAERGTNSREKTRKPAPIQYEESSSEDDDLDEDEEDEEEDDDEEEDAEGDDDTGDEDENEIEINDEDDDEGDDNEMLIAENEEDFDDDDEADGDVDDDDDDSDA